MIRACVAAALFIAGCNGRDAGSPSPVPDNVKEDDRAIDGTWREESAELGGQDLSDEVRKSIKLAFGDGKYTVLAGQKPDSGTLKLDPSKKPMTVDFTASEGPNKGKTIFAIYERSGDKLRLCYDLNSDVRPSEFKTAKGTHLFLATYTREKP
jgi:uncharacterized protein (TIGR03067 family)